MIRLRGATALALALLLAGCEGQAPRFDRDPWDVGAVEAMERPSDPELAALYDGYLDLARAEMAEFDWADGAQFLDKAVEAVGGTRPAPYALAERRVPARRMVELQGAEGELAVLLSSRGARLRAGVLIAEAQIAYDCWVQEAGEDHQEDDIAACRDLFNVKIAEAREAAQLPKQLVVVLPEEDGSIGGVVLQTEGAEDLVLDRAFAAGSGAGDAVVVDEGEVREVFAGALAARPIPPSFFVIRFDSGLSRLDDAAGEVLDAILADIARRPVAEVVLAGHADLLGSNAVNLALSRRRAVAVREAVAERLGETAEVVFAIDARGELAPAVPNPGDEPRNRRVEITVR